MHVITQHHSFSDVDLQDLGQVSKTTIEVVYKDREVVHENFQAVAKKVGEDCRHASLKCRRGGGGGGLHSPNGMRLKVNVPKGHVNVIFS